MNPIRFSGATIHIAQPSDHHAVRFRLDGRDRTDLTETTKLFKGVKVAGETPIACDTADNMCGGLKSAQAAQRAKADFTNRTKASYTELVDTALAAGQLTTETADTLKGAIQTNRPKFVPVGQNSHIVDVLF